MFWLLRFTLKMEPNYGWLILKAFKGECDFVVVWAICQVHTESLFKPKIQCYCQNMVTHESCWKYVWKSWLGALFEDAYRKLACGNMNMQQHYCEDLLKHIFITNCSLVYTTPDLKLFSCKNKESWFIVLHCLSFHAESNKLVTIVSCRVLQSWCLTSLMSIFSLQNLTCLVG